MATGNIPSGETGSGVGETFQYELGDDYSAGGTPHPLLVAYHGYGSSAASVATASLMDDEANRRAWVYMAPTGLDDQLFGSPPSQLNTAAAIQWMLDNANVDPDQVYLVGFSMGGGVVANFAARHRDPAGIMAAAVGMISPTVDWTQEHALGTSAVQAILEHPFNFGSSPAVDPWAYQQASAVYFDPVSYPPLTAPTAVAADSMARNLGGLPVYVTHDVGDTIEQVPGAAAGLVGLLEDQGADVVHRLTAGTRRPDGAVQTHDWHVALVTSLFDHLGDSTVTRYPASFDALQDLGGAVSWATTTQRAAGDFTRLTGAATPASDAMAIAGVENATTVELHAGNAGATAMPVRVTATSADADGFDLLVTGLPGTPTGMEYVAGGAPVPGVTEPVAGTLQVTIAGMGTLDAYVVDT